MAMFFEVYLRNHHGVATATEVGSVSQILCEEVAGVDDARDVFDVGETKLMGFAYVKGAVADMFEFSEAFAGGNDFSFTGTQGCTVLAYGLPADGPPCPADNVARYATEFEEFKGSAIWDCVAKLSTPACVGERC
eukprot:scaffold23741_cov22-Cyclotella_meneghiniana.AAC.2